MSDQTTAINPSSEDALSAFLDMLKTAQRDKLLPLVNSALIDFPLLGDYIFMQPEKMLRLVKTFWPKLRPRIEREEALLVKKLYEVQGRLKAME